MTPQTPASPAPRAGRGGAGLLPDARTTPACGAFGPSGYRCDLPAVRTVAVGCVHEHVKTDGRACDEHARWIEKGLLSCAECYDLPEDPHRCELLGRVVA